MAKTISNVSVGLFGNVAHFANAFGKTAVGAVTGFTGKLASAGASALKFTGIAGAIGASIAAIGAVGSGFKLASDFEQAEVAFTTMLGSADAAKGMLQSLTDFAASTPFEFPEVLRSSKSLLAMGVSAAKIIPTMTAIGDVAAGLGIPVNELAETFGKIKAGGFQGADLNALAGRGIPIFAELAKVMGVNQNQIKKMVEEGKIGFPQVEAAFANMSGEGGKFSGLMAKQSGTLGGLFSTLKDTLGNTLRRIATTIVETFNLKGAMSSLIANGGNISDTLVGVVQRVAPVLKSFGAAVVSAFGTVYNVVAPILARVYGIVSNVFAAVANVVTTYGAAAWQAAQTVWAGIYGTVAPIVGAIYSTVAANWSAIVTTVTTFGMAVWDVVRTVWTGIVGITTTVATYIVEAFNYWAQAITGTSQTAGESVTGIFGWIGEKSGGMSDAISMSLQAASFSLSNWQQTAEIVGLNVALFFVKTGNQLEYVFTEVIPAAASYTWRVVKSVFTDGVNMVKTVIGNLASNVVAVFSNLPGLISGKVNFSDVWKPLTEGFKATASEAFNLPDRVVGDFEKQLATDLDGLETTFGEGLGKHLSDKQQEAKRAAVKVMAGIKEIVAPKLDAVGKIEAPKVEAPKIPPIPLSAVLDKDSLALQIKPEIKLGKAMRVGSAEAQLAGLGFNPKAIAKAAVAPALGVAGVGGSKGVLGPPAPPKLPPLPPLPRNAVEQGAVNAQKFGAMDDYWKDQITATNKQTNLLDKIEQQGRAATLTPATF